MDDQEIRNKKIRMNERRLEMLTKMRDRFQLRIDRVQEANNELKKGPVTELDSE